MPDDTSPNNSKPNGRRPRPAPPDLKPSSSPEARRQSAKSSDRDITPMLKGWDYEPGTINVRRIKAADGSEKLQMRLDLGLLQMELKGRPDGVRPKGCESWLDYYQRQLVRHKKKNGTELGFQLTGEQCQHLREEAEMYYRRYLSLFVLGEFKGVVRDTARNIRVLNLCGQFAADEADRLVLEQYRPYITMMNTRAAASAKFKAKEYVEALEVVERGLKRIRRFFKRFGQPKAYRRSGEVKVLKRFARQIQRKIPVDPLQKLETELQAAVDAEAYEKAAVLRDQIEAMQRDRAAG